MACMSRLCCSWYGPGDPKLCFIERKTHRESWKGGWALLLWLQGGLQKHGGTGLASTS